ncbi:MAG: ATP-binding protein, partial [Methanobrevibacter sp.]
MKKNVFPFTAIVGQDKIKKALILNAINPSIGGVLIKGDRGTGKTTAVRALADLLPEIEVVEDCAFNCDLKSYRDFELYK